MFQVWWWNLDLTHSVAKEAKIDPHIIEEANILEVGLNAQLWEDKRKQKE